MDEPVYRCEYPVNRADFDTAGEASANIKRTLKKMGVAPDIVREIAIVSYELELNLVIHSLGGRLLLELYKDKLILSSIDRGPGIPNIDLALQEGYSTASADVRNMGFGAGMGLPNIRRHSQEFHIESSENGHTEIRSTYHLNGGVR